MRTPGRSRRRLLGDGRVVVTARTDFDSELQRHDAVLRRACGVRPGEHVLDIGCGTGRTTRDAALAARHGSALGVDICARSVDRAREPAGAAGLSTVAFEHADAQTFRFPPSRFDVAISRFGTMFFDDPTAAFANVGRALRPDGRLVMMVWQARERNEWIVAIHRALHDAGAPRDDDPGGPDPFSLADPATVTDVLDAAGFADVTFADVREPVHYGADVDAALEWVHGFTCTAAALDRLGPAAAERTVARLRDLLAAHADADGVRFDSRAWTVTARRR